MICRVRMPLVVVPAIAAVAVALATPAIADAKLCVRIAAPKTAARGEPIRVSVTTLEPTSWTSGRPVGLLPVAASFRLRLLLQGPNSAYREVVLQRVISQPSVSRAT